MPGDRGGGFGGEGTCPAGERARGRDRKGWVLGEWYIESGRERAAVVLVAAAAAAARDTEVERSRDRERAREKDRERDR